MFELKLIPRTSTKMADNFIYQNPDQQLTLEVINIGEDNETNFPKKRKAYVSADAQRRNKLERDKGLRYEKTTGEIIEKKTMGAPCECKLECFEKIGEKNCASIFENFWKIGNYCLQNSYLVKHMHIEPMKRPRRRTDSSKEVSCTIEQEPAKTAGGCFKRTFFVTVDGEDIEVCKTAFLNLHSVSNGRIIRLLKKKAANQDTGLDLRGCHGNRLAPGTIAKDEKIREFIDDYRKECGYTAEERKPKSAEIFPFTFTKRSLFQIYQQTCINNGETAQGEFRFRKIFKEDFNIEFEKPPQGWNRTVASRATLPDTTPLPPSAPSDKIRFLPSAPSVAIPILQSAPPVTMPILQSASSVTMPILQSAPSVAIPLLQCPSVGSVTPMATFQTVPTFTPITTGFILPQQPVGLQIIL